MSGVAPIVGIEPLKKPFCGATLYLFLTFQSTFGVRLPIVQGGTFSFLAPTFAILTLKRNECPAKFKEVLK